MRLQKYLASCGVASRRKCEEYILEGLIAVNGSIVTELGTQVNEEDCVTYRGREVKLSSNYVYYMLNKPVGYVTTVKDEKDRPTVMDLLEEKNNRIYPVGRLDYNTSGLLILTNDGELTYALTHPKHDVNKTYHVKVRGTVTDTVLEKLRKGIVIDGRKTVPALAEIMSVNPTTTVLSLTIHEGRNRQVRKMCEAVGHIVLKLSRVSVGELTLDGLKAGQYRKLRPDEIAYLKKVGGLHA